LTCKVNATLLRENSAYRIVGGKVSAIIDEIQIKSIEGILASESIAKLHIEKASSFLWNKGKPDYPNSIKESISAFEAELRVKLNEPKGVGSELLKKLKHQNSGLHILIIESAMKIYSYRGDADGVAHASKREEFEPEFEDALCILVMSSALCQRISKIILK
jgi:hypothetical protein